MTTQVLPTILIADDHYLFNDALANLLTAPEVPYQIIGQVYSGDEVLAAVHTLRPQVLLLDINMPGRNGLDIAQQLVKENPNLRIVFLTMYGSVKFVEEAQAIGVAGYMLKNIRKTSLLEGLAIILAGGVYFDPSLQNLLAVQHQEDDFFKQFSLTKREIEIIPLLCQGLTNADVARKLYLAEQTVKTHRKNIYYKLGISHLADLIKFATSHNL
ncbi:response regulator [Spirosoma litoris]